jgi:hypothetical protein
MSLNKCPPVIKPILHPKYFLSNQNQVWNLRNNTKFKAESVQGKIYIMIVRSIFDKKHPSSKPKKMRPARMQVFIHNFQDGELRNLSDLLSQRKFLCK